jgi:hypothetical protein
VVALEAPLAHSQLLDSVSTDSIGILEEPLTCLLPAEGLYSPEQVQAAVRFRSAAVGSGSSKVLWTRAYQDEAAPTATTICVHLSADGGERLLCEAGSSWGAADPLVDVSRTDAGPEAVFTAQIGPMRLPSEHLNELRESGFTKLRAVPIAEIASIKSVLKQRMESLITQREAAGVQISGQGRIQEFNLSEDEDVFRLVERNPFFARLHANPVMLHLLEAFTGGPVRAAHPPSTRITMPQNGDLGPGGGW